MSLLGVGAFHDAPIVIKGGTIPANTTTVLNHVTGGLLFVGAFSGCAIYFCEYWSTNCNKIIGLINGSVSKNTNTANVSVRYLTRNTQLKHN